MSSFKINNLYKKFNTAGIRSIPDFSNIRNISSLNPKTFSLLKSLKRNHFIYALAGVLLIGSFLIGRYFSSGSLLGSGSDIRENAPAPVATQVLNKKFEFPLLDEKGSEVARISYFVESANLQDAFIYQGKLAKAVKGRTFLIFNLKITNPYSKTIQINSKDYLRVMVNGKEERLASEINNDPVEIQADSTKYTRIGLPINDTDENLVLLIGELNGKKETINLNLSR